MRCEEFVNDYLPSVKAKIAYVLYNEYDLKQTEISDLLDITQPAVSQYIKGSRGKTMDISEELSISIEEITEEIYEYRNDENYGKEKIDELMCKVCKSI